METPLALTSGSRTAEVLELLHGSLLYRPLTLYTGPKELMPAPPITAR